MARRKKRGASFANRKTAESEIEMRKKEQQTTILYSAIGLAAILALCFIVYLIYRPASSASTATDSNDVVESEVATEAETSAEGSASETVADTASGEGAASVAPAERNNYYSSPPEMIIDSSKSYQALIKTDKGDMLFDLFTEEAPITVNNFVFLAREGFYNDTMFHRVIENFMAQGGDPTGTGTGGPGYRFEDEVDNDLAFDRRGLLAMANSGPATNGSQFFITFVDTPHLTGLHTIYGELIEGDDVLASLSIRDPRENSPGDLINSIEIIEN